MKARLATGENPLDIKTSTTYFIVRSLLSATIKIASQAQMPGEFLFLAFTKLLKEEKMIIEVIKIKNSDLTEDNTEDIPQDELN